MIVKLQTKQCDYPEEVSTLFGQETFSNPETHKFANYLGKICEWNKILTLFNSIPMNYDDRELRFFKAWIIQLAIQKYSSNKLKFIGADGYDFIVDDNDSQYHGCKIELKSGKQIFSKQDSFTLRNAYNKTSSITLSNSNGSSIDKIYNKKYDFLLLLDKSGYAVTTYDKVLPRVKNSGDGFRATLNIIDLEIVCLVDENTVQYLDVDIPDSLNCAAMNIIGMVENA